MNHREYDLTNADRLGRRSLARAVLFCPGKVLKRFC